MKRYRATYPRDDASAGDGDAAFTGVNMKLGNVSPEKLPAGTARLAINKVMRDGRAATRAGILTTVHHNPRLWQEGVRNVSWLVVTCTYTAANGRKLMVQGTCTNPSITLGVTANRVTATTNPGGYNPLAQVNAFNPSSDYATCSMCFDLDTARSIPSGTGGVPGRTFVTIAGAWLLGSQSAGGNGWVSVTLQTYYGGTMALVGTTWVNTGGAPAAPMQRLIQLSTDTMAASPPTLETLATITGGTADEHVTVQWPCRYAPVATIGTSGWMATAPTLPDTIYGSGLYADAAGDEWMLLATPSGIYAVADGRTPRRFATPAVIGQACEFQQFTGTVFLYFDEATTPWQWDGTTTGTWQIVPQLTTTDGTVPMPDAGTAEVISNRVAVPASPDTAAAIDAVTFSDVLTPLRTDDTKNVFAVNQGTESTLVRIYPFSNTNLLCFKSRELFMFSNVTGDLSTVTLTQVTGAPGCVARKSVCAVGSDVWYLGPNGIFSVVQMIERQYTTTPAAVTVPVSDPMEPFFRQRVNWPAAAGAVATVWNEYYFLAIAIDGSAVNNALLCFNTTTQSWEGWHTFPAGAAITNLLQTKFNGQKRLYATDLGRGCVYLMYEGWLDRTLDVQAMIGDTLETRGYLVGSAELKYFTRCELTLQTWGPPSVSVGIGTEYLSRTAFTGRTKDPTKYYQWGVTPYVINNANGDHDAAGREDYTVLGTAEALFGSAIGLELLAERTERTPIKLRGRYAFLTITNTSGRCDVAGVSVEARLVMEKTTNDE